METRVLLLEQEVAHIKSDIQDYRELRETVALLKQSVELLHKTVWGVLACFGGGIVIIVLNTIFKGVM